jgi:flagellar hook-basal body complex protein FliE
MNVINNAINTSNLSMLSEALRSGTNINNVDIFDAMRIGADQEQHSVGGFGSIMDAAIRLFDETSRIENDLTQLQIDYIAGHTDDMLAVMLAEQRAMTAVTFTTQITSKIMDAYRQIMNMQI